MATLNIDLKLTGFDRGIKNINSLTVSLERLEAAVKKVNLRPITDKLQQQGAVIGKATAQINQYKAAIQNIKPANVGNLNLTGAANTIKEVRSLEAALKKATAQINQYKAASQSIKPVNAGNLNLTGAANTIKEVRSLEAALKSLQNQTGKFSLAKVTNETRRADRDIQGLTTQTRRLETSVRSADRANKNFFKGMGGGLPVIGRFTGAMGLAYLAYESLQKSFRTNLQFDAIEYSLMQVSNNATHFEVTLNRLRGESERLGLDFKTMAGTFRQWQAAAKFSNLTSEETYKIFQSVANAGAKLKLSNEQVEGTFLALSQMMSKGVVSMEELRRQLGDRLYGAFQLAAQAMGISEAELNKLVATGKIASEDFLPKFAEQLDKSFGNDKIEKIETMQASVNRLGNEWDKLWRSESATTFFTKASDGLAKFLNKINLFISARSFKELTAALQGDEAGLNIHRALREGGQAGAGRYFAQINAADTNLKGIEKELIRARNRRRELIKELESSSGEERQNLIKSANYYAGYANELAKIWRGLSDTIGSTNKGVDGGAGKIKGTVIQTTEILQKLRAETGSYFEQKFSVIGLSYDKLVKKIAKSKGSKAEISEALGLAKAKKDFDEFKLSFDELLFRLKPLEIDYKKFSKGLPAIGAPTIIPITPEAEARFYENTRNRTRAKDKGDPNFEKRLKRIEERGLRMGLENVFNDITELGGNFYDVFTNVFQRLASSVTDTFGRVIAAQLGNALSKSISSEDFKLLGLSAKQSQALIAGGGLLGSVLSAQGASKGNVGLSGLGGAATGAAAGAAIGSLPGAIIGGVVGLVSGLFGGNKAKKEAERQQKMLEEQQKQTKLMEREAALAFTSSITGQKIEEGIVTNVDRNAFGEIEFTIEGRKLRAVLERENAAVGRGL